MNFKKEARFIGIDDAPFNKFKDRHVLVVGTVFRGGEWLDGVLSTKVEVDGSDATKKLVAIIAKSKFKPQLQAILLDGIAMGGFNVVDVKMLFQKTAIPVIVVMRNFPDFEVITKVLTRLGMERKIRLLKNAGIPQKVGHIYIQHIGISFDAARQIVEKTSTKSFIPEPLRIAHIIAAGIIKGESSGGA